MEKFKVNGIPPFDGDYPIDVGTFTMREFQIIKRMSGVRAGELEEALQAGDTTLILAIAVIAVRRAGKQWEAFEQLAWESEIGEITFESEKEEPADDAVPLTQPKPSDISGSTAELPPPSGATSSDDGEVLPEKNLRAIGGQH